MSVFFTRTGTNIDGFMDEKTNQCKRSNQKGPIGPGTPRQKSNPDRGRMCLYTITAATNDVPFQKRRKPISMYYNASTPRFPSGSLVGPWFEG